LVQVASKAFIPQHAGRPSLAFTGADKSAMSNRHAIQPGDRCPSKYSEEEAYYRTGVSGGATPYAANELGGALRRLRVYGQDAVGKSTGETLCTKYKGDNKKLNAGMFVRLLLLVFLRQLRSTCCFSCQGLERLHILASCCPHFHGIKGAEVQKCMSSLKEMGDFVLFSTLVMVIPRVLHGSVCTAMESNWWVFDKSRFLRAGCMVRRVRESSADCDDARS
jgi:hypothetical protein